MIVFGKQIFWYIINNKQTIVKTIYLSKEIDKKLFSKIVKTNIPIVKMDNKKAQSMARGGNHQGYFLEIEDIEVSNLKKDSKLSIILLNITDSGNLGAIVRTAYAFGVEQIIVSGMKNINFESIMRTSSGALLNSNIHINEDIGDVLNQLQQNNFEIYAMDMKGTSIKEFEYKDNKKAIILGNEGDGIPNKILKKSNQVLSIPMKRFNSLNVSVAAGIILERIVNEQ